jgi:hypothetical protein
MTEEEGESDTTTGGHAQRVATQLLVMGGKILVGNGRG